ncbi:MAG: PP2C family protein-serine/threonine phosphatase [Phycisphaerae bacterium]
MGISDDAANASHSHDGWGLTMTHLACLRGAMFMVRFSPLWSEIKHLAGWLENEALPEAVHRHQTTLTLRIGEDQDGELRFSWEGGELGACRSLAEFLAGMGVRRIVLDSRLEGNQVSDVLTLLWGFRRRLADRPASDCADTLVSMLSGEGVRFSCTRTRLAEGQLEVDYCYCLTRFSRAVQWFERRHRHFSDHRAIFAAAPRYAIVTAGVALAPFLLYWAWPYEAVLVAATLLEVFALFGLVYLALMTVGSVEYDNEEKAHRLAEAYERVDSYAKRIRADLQRAEAVQRKMLPSLEHMPFGDRVEWAFTFVPEEDVGGDYYDVAALDENRVAIVFCDVSGHGMAAAFITAILKSEFKAWVDDGWSLDTFIERTNDSLCRLTPVGWYAAVFAGVFDTSTGRLEYINGGHNPEPWVVRARDADRLDQLNDARVLLLGVADEVGFNGQSTTLDAGDMLLMVTDGLIEAINPDREMYTQERLVELLETYPVDNADHLVKRVNEDVGRFTEDAPQTDDRTVLAMRVREVR